MFVYVLTLLGCPATEDTAGKPDDSAVDSGDSGGDTEHLPSDNDGDGYDVGEDCDDANPNVHPGATEECDGIDNDCNGLTDDQDVDAGVGYTWYTDTDHDGYGQDGTEHVSCEPESNDASFGGDCDDQDGAVYPGAAESCNEKDDDCDGLIDDDDPDAATGEFWFPDNDGDGFGDEDADGAGGCDQPAGTVDNDDDCDDADPTANPDGKEVCDELNTDEDCDGGADDEDPNGPPEGNYAWYYDADGDGYGDIEVQTYNCDGGGGYVAEVGDCAIDDPSINPGAAEECDGIDQNCNGTIDEGAPGWYPDADGDGYGDAATTPSCDATDGVDNSGDCDDTDPEINAGATEVCGGIDEDCDGLIDDADDSLDAALVYVDGDADGYGTDASAIVGCGTAPAFSSVGGDCDDSNADIGPGEAEHYGDSVDDNCDGVTTPTWEVCSGAQVPADFATIAEAVAVTESTGGGTVCVAAGTYTEDLDLGVSAAVELVGEDPETTLITGDVSLYGQATGLGQLSIEGGVRVYAEAAMASAPRLRDLRIAGVDGPGIWIWLGAGGALDVELNGLDLSAAAPSAALQVAVEDCDGTTSPDLALATTGVWIHDSTYGVELQASGSTCLSEVDLDWVTFTDNDDAVYAEVSGGSLDLLVDHSLVVGSTTGVTWQTVFGGGAITGDVTNSMFYGNTADFGATAHAGSGYMWGTDPGLDTTFSPPVPGHWARDAFLLDARPEDYWGTACVGGGCDYGAVEGG